MLASCDTRHHLQEIIGFLDAEATKIYAEQFPDDEGVQIQTRPFNLTECQLMRNLNPSDMEKLVSIKGMVIRLSTIIPDIQIGFFQCSACSSSEEVRIESGRIKEPTACKSCNVQQSMQLIHNRCIFADKQLVRLQESPEDIPEGETPFTVNLCAFDEMVDVSKPGDRVEVTGIYRAMPIRVNSSQRTLKCVYKTYIDVIHFKRSDSKRMGDVSEEGAYFEGSTHSDTLKAEKAERAKLLAASGDIYQKLINSFAPSIYEMDDVKKGLLCLLFGGSNPDHAGASTGRFRGDINVLLVGDPGVSKSQLLQYVHRIAPRGIYTSGKGSSAVGLTAYVTKDPETKELVLESGALVLSDRGICCIDEFDKMSEATRAILHEAMEQQTISVAKAGIICSLNARTSILAAANPIQSRYNPQLSVVENMNLPPTLLSRFDLIYLMLDKPNPASDRRLAKHLVSLYYAEQQQPADSVLDLETFADYVSYARNECSPTLTDEATSALIDGYVQMRRISTNRNTISATPRQLESIIRLSEAHAKMRLAVKVRPRPRLAHQPCTVFPRRHCASERHNHPSRTHPRFVASANQGSTICA
jgi:DNA replication licensing factor MCM4